jgi:hypothetical protein
VTRLADVCEDYAHIACDHFERDGYVQPVMWAIGSRRNIFATPVQGEESDVSVVARVVIHAMMAAHVDAEYVGSIHEAWVTERAAGDPLPKQGTLGVLAESDPTIRTAIITHGMSVEGNYAVMHMARLDLHSDGSVCWEHESVDEFDVARFDELPETATPLQMLSWVVETLPVNIDFDAALLYAGTKGWMILEGRVIEEEL